MTWYNEECWSFTGFIPYSGDGFALLLPSKWNPSKEKEESGVVLRVRSCM